MWAVVLSSIDPTFDMRDITRLEIDPQVLAKRLYSFLEGKRYFVVLDDVWSIEDWESLKPGFPMEGSRGKVLITSRNKEGALHVDPRVYLHEMQFLNDENSWELFQKIVLWRRRDLIDKVIDAKMEELGRKMVKRCEGLPLAITTIGGILATKDCTYNEWQNVHDKVKSYLRQGKTFTVQDSLSLSYNDLPLYLKPCFLYLAHFPKDFEIHVQMLLHMWVAEGFTSSGLDEETIEEDVAESYLIELLDRCMVQVGERHANLKIKSCRMHNLMRDLCLSKAKQEKFLYIIDHLPEEGDHSVASRTHSVHRVATNVPGITQQIKIPSLRTLMIFDSFVMDTVGELLEDSQITYGEASQTTYGDNHEKGNISKALIIRCCAIVPLVLIIGQHIKGVLSHIFGNSKMLRVLHLEGQIPFMCGALNNIGSLIHLRYLSLAGNGLWKFPSSLGKLRCLQTLDLRVNCELGAPEIPDVICRLEQLRHLYLPERCTRKTKLRLRNLRKLQTLVNFPVNNCQLQDLCDLTNLQELTICGANDYSDEFYRFCEDNCCSCMQLFIDRNCHLFLGIKEDLMPMLGGLPNLRILALKEGAFMGEKMVCSAGAFPRLESLTLDFLPHLEELRVDEGALYNLNHLMIRSCKNLKMLPIGLKYVTTLQKVDIESMPEDFGNWWKDDKAHPTSSDM